MNAFMVKKYYKEKEKTKKVFFSKGSVKRVARDPGHSAALSQWEAEKVHKSLEVQFSEEKKCPTGLHILTEINEEIESAIDV